MAERYTYKVCVGNSPAARCTSWVTALRMLAEFTSRLVETGHGYVERSDGVIIAMVDLDHGVKKA